MALTTPETPADCKAEMDKPGLRERQRQARDEAILQAAFALINEHGYEALTMESLAERVGITRQTLYHHFSSREEIAVRAIVTMVDESTRVLLEIEPNSKAVQRLKSIMRWMLARRFSPECAELVKARLSLLPIKARPECRLAFERRAQVLETIVETAQAECDLSMALPSGLVVQMLLGLVSDSHYEELIAARLADVPQIIEGVIEVFFRGLRPADNGGQ